MNIEEFRLYCLNKKGVTEAFPFDQSTLVFKVMNKMFALTSIHTFTSVNLKCDPDLAVELRENYDFVKPGFHMSKIHWNTIEIDWQLEDRLLKEWVDHSYDLVVEKLTKKQKEALNNL